MHSIKSINIKNIKGFTTEGKLIRFGDIGLLPKKFNICFAYNGFGKTSFATAIGLLESCEGKLEAKKDLLFQNKEENLPEIIVETNKGVLKADSVSNSISPVLKCHVINSHLTARKTTTFVKDYKFTKGLLDISDIVVYDHIPSKKLIIYNYTQNKKNFGTNASVVIDNLKNIFENINFLKLIIDGDNKKILDTYYINKGEKGIVRTIKKWINEYKGKNPIKDIDNYIKGNRAFNEDKNLIFFFNTIEPYIKFDIDSPIKKFGFLWQILELLKNNQKFSGIENIIRYKEYGTIKKELQEVVKDLNDTWKQVTVKENHNKLIVGFPNAESISNGQRDVRTFLIDLKISESKIRNNPEVNHLLVIDEVFDYLDDVNIIIAQYYLSKFIEKYGNVFPVILTHLAPKEFRTYIIKVKALNPISLQSSNPLPNEKFKYFISYRNSLDKTVGSEKNLYDKISHNLLHYNPSPVDIDNREVVKHSDKLKKNWLNYKNFREVLYIELIKYLKSEESYDPYAICIALRLAIEKKMYDLLESEDLRHKFLEDCHKTKEKIELVEVNDIPINETWKIISPIFNDAAHINFNNKFKEIYEKDMTYKIGHTAIKSIVLKILEVNEGQNIDKGKFIEDCIISVS